MINRTSSQPWNHRYLLVCTVLNCKVLCAQRLQERAGAQGPDAASVEMHAGTWPISLHQVPASTSAAPCYRKLYRKCWALVVVVAPVVPELCYSVRPRGRKELWPGGVVQLLPLAPKDAKAGRKAGRGAIRFQPAKPEAKMP